MDPNEVAVGGVMVGWTRTEIKSEELRVNNGQASAINFQPSMATSQPFVFKGQGMQQNPAFKSILPATNVPQIRFPSQFTMAPGSPNASGPRLQPLNSPALQQVQNVPEVKAARDALTEAQQKYFASMQSALAKAAPQSGPKTAPLTIQLPPAGSGTNGMTKAKL
jgi:hypothetical protein